MYKRLSRMAAVLMLAGSGLVLGAQSDSISDLDDLTPAQLEQELIDEIDDLFLEQDVNPNGVYPDDLLENIIFNVLHDDGDDENEDDLDFNELESEMEEVGTNVAAVVHEAVEAADLISGRQESPSSTGVLARAMRDTPLFRLANVGLGLLPQNKNARAGTAACQTAQRLVGRSLPQKMPYQSRCRF